MVQNDEQLLQLRGERRRWGEADEERALPLAELDAAGQRLDDLRRSQEAVEVLQDQHASPFRARELLAGANGRQGIVPSCRVFVAFDALQSRFDVPGRQPPLLAATDGGNFSDGFVVF